MATRPPKAAPRKPATPIPGATVAPPTVQPTRPRAAAGAGIKVRATQAGYAGDARRRVGDVFTIPSMDVFSEHWMELVDPETPERITTGADHLRQQHDQLLADRHQGGQHVGADNPTGATDVFGDDN